MKLEELLRKIGEIEQQAKDGLAEFPALNQERLRMILAYARYLRTGVLASQPIGWVIDNEPKRSQNDDSPVRKVNST